MILDGYHAMQRTNRVLALVALVLSLVFFWVIWHISPLFAALGGIAVLASLWLLYVTFRDKPIIPLAAARPWEGSAFGGPPFDDDLPWTHDQEFE